MVGGVWECGVKGMLPGPARHPLWVRDPTAPSIILLQGAEPSLQLLLPLIALEVGVSGGLKG